MSRKDLIITLPDQRLRQISTKVGVVSDKIRELIATMEQATLDWEDSREHEVGVALAAVQIAEMTRVVIVRENFDDKNNRSFHAYINPVITKFEGAIEEDYEGCLSIKDVYGRVPRYHKVRVKALNLEDREIRLTAEGFLARVFQHEIDHTKGKLFIDHIKETPDAFFRLTTEGKLEPLDYEKDVKQNSLLW